MEQEIIICFFTDSREDIGHFLTSVLGKRL